MKNIIKLLLLFTMINVQCAFAAQEFIPPGSVSVDPCQTIVHNYTPINIATTAPQIIIPLVSAKKTYICSIYLKIASTMNIAMVEGTLISTNCDTATAGLSGGTTAATGWQFSSNQDLRQGDGSFAVAATAMVAHDVCLLMSGSGQVSGNVVWVQK